jgi:hypothetical protein
MAVAVGAGAEVNGGAPPRGLGLGAQHITQKVHPLAGRAQGKEPLADFDAGLAQRRGDER